MKKNVTPQMCVNSCWKLCIRIKDKEFLIFLFFYLGSKHFVFFQMKFYFHNCFFPFWWRKFLSFLFFDVLIYGIDMYFNSYKDITTASTAFMRWFIIFNIIFCRGSLGGKYYFLRPPERVMEPGWFYHITYILLFLALLGLKPYGALHRPYLNLTNLTKSMTTHVNLLKKRVMWYDRAGPGYVQCILCDK